MGVKTHGKEQEDCSNLRNRINGFIRRHQVGDRRTDQHTGKNLPQHGRELQAFKDLSKELGPDENEEKLKKKWIASVHIVLARRAWPKPYTS